MCRSMDGNILEMDEVLKPGQSIKPIINEDEAKALVEKIYGLKCKYIKVLDGYDDKNYKIFTDEILDNNHINEINRDGYVLKILNSLDSQKFEFIESQNNVLLHLSKSSIINAPIPVPTKIGTYFTIEPLVSGKHVVRLMKYIEGTVLGKVPTSNDLLHQMGECIAKLDVELKNLSSAAYEKYKSLWMLDSVGELRKFTFALNDAEKIETVMRVVDKFESTVLNNKNNFEKGIIHGDVNEQNILVEEKNDKWEVKAILDFGDNQFSCYLFELAITLTYMLIIGRSLETGGHVIAGYHKIRPIPKKEFDLLKICVEARLCQSLVLGAYSSLQDPSNNYILTTSKPGWELLNKLTSTEDGKVSKLWEATASNYFKDFKLK